jgi:SNF2 family DNA or RNA helicase
MRKSMAYATLIDDKIVIQSAWNEKDTVKQVPGVRWDPDTKTWQLPVSWAACVQLRGVFGQTLQVGDPLNDWAIGELQKRITPSLMIRETWDEYVGDAVDTGLYDFQRAGRDWLCVAGDALLADEMGTGKTIQVLAALERLHKRGDEALPALVVSPNSVKTNWAKEAAFWFEDAVPYVVTGSAAERKKIITAAAKDPRALVIVNVEAVRLLSRLAAYGSIRLSKCRTCDKKNGEERVTAATCDVHRKALNEVAFRTVIVDEAHRIKDPKSKQTRAVWAMCHQEGVRRRWALTGTPIANNPADLWSIMHAVSPSEYPSKTRFVDRYCLLAWNNYGGMDVVGTNPVNREEFFKIFRPRFRRMLKSIVAPQLPRKIRSYRVVEMSPKAARAYKELDDLLYTDVDGELLVSTTNLSNVIRLMQLASAWVSVDEHGTVTLCDPSPKLDEMEIVLDELGDEPVVIAAEHKQLVLLAAKRLTKLGIPFGMITGGVSQFERGEAVRKLNEGHIRAVLMTVKAGGTGLNLQHARNLINLQRSWSMIDNKQTEDRVHRIGSEVHDVVNIIDIVTRGTVEEKQILSVRAKLDRLDEITEDRLRLMAAGQYDTFDLDTEETNIINSYALGVKL